MFVGLAIGSVFTIYKPLSPSVFSVGGIVLSFGLLVVAYNYDRLIKITRYKKILFFVEIVMLLMVVLYLVLPFDILTALLVYVGYQLTFVFGSYITRAETLFVAQVRYLSQIDRYKQYGYLVGLVVSWVFYKILANIFHIDTNEEQIYLLHFVLIVLQVVILVFLAKSFENS